MDRRVRLVSIVVGVAVAVAVGTALFAFAGGEDDPPEPSVIWETDAASAYDQNHHTPSAVTADGEVFLGLPVSDLDDADTCGVYVVDADGDLAWTFSVPPVECNPHAVGDVTGATLEGTPVFAVGTSEPRLRVFDAASGEERFAHDIEGLGYGAPAVADVTGDGTAEVVAANFTGGVRVVDADGELVWTRTFEGNTPLSPLAADVTGDGDVEIAVTESGLDARTTLLSAEGETLWRVPLAETPTSWQAVETERGPAFLFAGRDGRLLRIDAEDGEHRWDVRLQDGYVNVGDADGERVLVGGDGVVWAVTLGDGDVAWSRTLDGEGVVNAPVAGDVTGDGEAETVVVTHEGTVVVLRNDDVVARGAVDGRVYAPPTLADLTDDDSDEIVVFTGDARAIAFDVDA